MIGETAWAAGTKLNSRGDVTRLNSCSNYLTKSQLLVVAD